jgi:toxin ParE1/3/4
MADAKPYRVEERAWLELEAADNWYRSRSEDASAAFLSEVYRAFETIARAPHRWPNHLHGTRRYVLARFPFSIVYIDEPESVTIVAVAHNKRKPGYWRRPV